MEPGLVPGESLEAPTDFVLTWDARPGATYGASHFNYAAVRSYLDGYGRDLQTGRCERASAGAWLTVGLDGINAQWFDGFGRWSRFIAHGPSVQFDNRPGAGPR